MTAMAAMPRTTPAQPILRQGYRIGPVRFATPFDGARELAGMLPVTRLPGVPRWVRGLANFHGNPVPVFDVAPLLGVEHDRAVPEMLLVVGEGDRLAAIVIDGPPRRLRVEADDVVRSPAVPWSLERHVTQGLRDGDAVWLDFDPVRYLEELADVIGIGEAWTP